MAAFGAIRCWRLLQLADDRRLRKLMWFYGLFAASLVPMAVWTAQLAARLEPWSNVGELHSRFLAAEESNAWILAHHALMLASLAVAAQAFGQPRKTLVAAAGIAFASHIVPAALAIETALTLFLAVQAIRNHLQRRNPGARQVAIGFLLFFIGHLTVLLFHHPGGARTPLGDLLALIGLVVLVRLLPRPTA